MSGMLAALAGGMPAPAALMEELNCSLPDITDVQCGIGSKL